MQFSDTTNDQGIVQEARWIVGANPSSYPINDLTRNINRRNEEATSIIFEADGRWQHNDANNSENVYTDDLVEGTHDYDILVAHLRITRVEVSDTDGNWTRLKIIDQHEVQNTLTDFEKVNNAPRFYDLIGNKIYIYPAPDYDLTDGLKWWFQTVPDYFVPGDTTKEPGFSKLYHRYLSLGAALDYATKNNLDMRNRLKEELMEMREDMQHFYNRRSGDENIQLKVPQTNYR